MDILKLKDALNSFNISQITSKVSLDPEDWRTALNNADWDLISSYAGLLTLACTSIYAGSFGSVKVASEHCPPVYLSLFAC